jgi:hypothetical protein
MNPRHCRPQEWHSHLHHVQQTESPVSPPATSSTSEGTCPYNGSAPLNRQQQRARERACITGVLRDSNSERTGLYYRSAPQNHQRRGNVPVLQECPATNNTNPSERTSLYYRSAPQQHYNKWLSRERACITGVPRAKPSKSGITGTTTNRERTSLYYRSAPQQYNLPESQEWEPIHCACQLPREEQTTAAPNPFGWQEWREATRQARPRGR